MASNERINIPVELNLDYGDAISGLTKALKGVSSKSNIGQLLNSDLKKVTATIENLKRRMAAGVHSDNDILGINNAMAQLDSLINSLPQKMERIRFDDLALDLGQVKQLLLYSEKIAALKKDLRSLSDNKINSSFTGNTLFMKGMQLLELSSTTFKNIDELITRITAKSTDAGIKLEAANKQLAELMTKNKNVTTLSRDNLQRSLLQVTREYQDAKNQYQIAFNSLANNESIQQSTGDKIEKLKAESAALLAQILLSTNRLQQARQKQADALGAIPLGAKDESTGKIRRGGSQLLVTLSPVEMMLNDKGELLTTSDLLARYFSNASELYKAFMLIFKRKLQYTGLSNLLQQIKNLKFDGQLAGDIIKALTETLTVSLKGQDYSVSNIFNIDLLKLYSTLLKGLSKDIPHSGQVQIPLSGTQLPAIKDSGSGLSSFFSSQNGGRNMFQLMEEVKANNSGKTTELQQTAIKEYVRTYLQNLATLLQSKVTSGAIKLTTTKDGTRNDGSTWVENFVKTLPNFSGALSRDSNAKGGLGKGQGYLDKVNSFIASLQSSSTLTNGKYSDYINQIVEVFNKLDQVFNPILKDGTLDVGKKNALNEAGIQNFDTLIQGIQKLILYSNRGLSADRKQAIDSLLYKILSLSLLGQQQGADKLANGESNLKLIKALNKASTNYEALAKRIQSDIDAKTLTKAQLLQQIKNLLQTIATQSSQNSSTPLQVLNLKKLAEEALQKKNALLQLIKLQTLILLKLEELSKLILEYNKIRDKVAALKQTISTISSTNQTEKSAKQGLLKAALALLAALKQAILNRTRTPVVAAANNLQTKNNENKNSNGPTMDQTQQQLDNQRSAENATRSIQSYTNRLVGSYAIVNKITRAIHSAYTEIKQIDSAITGIATVTNMSASLLWGQVSQYTAIAKLYGVTTLGVYQVSQLYYQMGLSSNEVTSMTTLTLSMAKIAGLDYATATNYMASALNGFKMEASEASTVVDTYSALAATAATTTKLLAEAMSKTASIALSSGMSFESTSAMLTMMIETTRLAPENLGTAMKSMIARFQKIDLNPNESVTIDGLTTSFNDVDTALRSVGVSLTDATGQMRDLDDVIFELSAKWDTLDRNTQKWIANEAAGSRQQSRFLALMSNNTRLVELYNTALNSEDAALIQQAKTMDSVATKATNLKNTFTQFYTSIINGLNIKDVLDMLQAWADGFGSGINNALNSLTQLFSFIKTIQSASELAKMGVNAYYGNGFTPSSWGTIRSNRTNVMYGGQNRSTPAASPNASGNTSAQQQKNGIAFAQGIANAFNRGKVLITAEGFEQYKKSSLYQEKYEARQIAYAGLYKKQKLQADEKGIVTEKNPSGTVLKNAATYNSANQQYQAIRQTTFTLYLQKKMGTTFGKILLELKQKLGSIKRDLQGNYTELQQKQLEELNKQKTLLAAAKGLTETDLSKRAAAANELSQSLGKNQTIFGKLSEKAKLNSSAFMALSYGLQIVGTTIANLMRNSINNDTELDAYSKRQKTALASGLLGVTTLASGIAMAFVNPMMGIPSIISGAMLTVTSLISGTSAKTIEEFLEDANAALVTAARTKSSYNLVNLLNNKLLTLRKTMYNSELDYDTYVDSVNDLASSYPLLITQYDALGNAIAYEIEALKELVKYRQLNAAKDDLEAQVKKQAALKAKGLAYNYNSNINPWQWLVSGDDKASALGATYRSGNGNLYNSYYGEGYEDITNIPELAQMGIKGAKDHLNDYAQTYYQKLAKTYLSDINESLDQTRLDENGNLNAEYLSEVIDRIKAESKVQYTHGSGLNKSYSDALSDFEDARTLILSNTVLYIQSMTQKLQDIITINSTFSDWLNKSYYSTGWEKNIISAWQKAQTEDYSQWDDTKISSSIYQFTESYVEGATKFIKDQNNKLTLAQKTALLKGDTSGLNGVQLKSLKNGLYGTYGESIDIDTTEWGQVTQLLDLQKNLYTGGKSTTNTVEATRSGLLGYTASQIQYINNAWQAASAMFKYTDENGDTKYQEIFTEASTGLMDQIQEWYTKIFNEAEELTGLDLTEYTNWYKNIDFSSYTGLITSLSNLVVEMPEIAKQLGITLDLNGLLDFGLGSSEITKILEGLHNTSSKSYTKTFRQSAATLQSTLSSYYEKIITGTLLSADVDKLILAGFTETDFETGENGNYKLKIGENQNYRDLVSSMLTTVLNNQILSLAKLADDASTLLWLGTDEGKAWLASSDYANKTWDELIKENNGEGAKAARQAYAGTTDWQTKIQLYRNAVDGTVNALTEAAVGSAMKTISTFSSANGHLAISKDTKEALLGLGMSLLGLFTFDEFSNSYELTGGYDTFVDEWASTISSQFGVAYELAVEYLKLNVDPSELLKSDLAKQIKAQHSYTYQLSDAQTSISNLLSGSASESDMEALLAYTGKTAEEFKDFYDINANGTYRATQGFINLYGQSIPGRRANINQANTIKQTNGTISNDDWLLMSYTQMGQSFKESYADYFNQVGDNWIWDSNLAGMTFLSAFISWVNKVFAGDAEAQLYLAKEEKQQIISNYLSASLLGLNGVSAVDEDTAKLLTGKYTSSQQEINYTLGKNGKWYLNNYQGTYTLLVEAWKSQMAAKLGSDTKLYATWLADVYTSQYDQALALDNQKLTTVNSFAGMIGLNGVFSEVSTALHDKFVALGQDISGKFIETANGWKWNGSSQEFLDTLKTYADTLDKTKKLAFYKSTTWLNALLNATSGSTTESQAVQQMMSGLTTTKTGRTGITDEAKVKWRELIGEEKWSLLNLDNKLTYDEASGSWVAAAQENAETILNEYYTALANETKIPITTIKRLMLKNQAKTNFTTALLANVDLYTATKGSNSVIAALANALNGDASSDDLYAIKQAYGIDFSQTAGRGNSDSTYRLSYGQVGDFADYNAAMSRNLTSILSNISSYYDNDKGGISELNWTKLGLSQYGKQFIDALTQANGGQAITVGNDGFVNIDWSLFTEGYNTFIDTVFANSPLMAEYYKSKLQESIAQSLLSVSLFSSNGSISGIDEETADALTAANGNLTFTKGKDGKSYLNMASGTTAVSYINLLKDALSSYYGSESVQFQNWLTTQYPQLLADAYTFDNADAFTKAQKLIQTNLLGQKDLITLTELQAIKYAVVQGTATALQAAIYTTLYGRTATNNGDGTYSVSDATSAKVTTSTQSADVKRYNEIKKAQDEYDKALSNWISGGRTEGNDYDTYAQAAKKLNELTATAITDEDNEALKQRATAANLQAISSSNGTISVDDFTGTLSSYMSDTFKAGFTQIGDSLIWTNTSKTFLLAMIEQINASINDGSISSEVGNYLKTSLNSAITKSLTSPGLFSNGVNSSVSQSVANLMGITLTDLNGLYRLDMAGKTGIDVVELYKTKLSAKLGLSSAAFQLFLQKLYPTLLANAYTFDNTSSFDNAVTLIKTKLEGTAAQFTETAWNEIVYAMVKGTATALQAATFLAVTGKKATQYAGGYGAAGVTYSGAATTENYTSDFDRITELLGLISELTNIQDITGNLNTEQLSNLSNYQQLLAQLRLKYNTDTTEYQQRAYQSALLSLKSSNGTTSISDWEQMDTKLQAQIQSYYSQIGDNMVFDLNKAGKSFNQMMIDAINATFQGTEDAKQYYINTFKNSIRLTLTSEATSLVSSGFINSLSSDMRDILVKNGVSKSDFSYNDQEQKYYYTGSMNAVLMQQTAWNSLEALYGDWEGWLQFYNLYYYTTMLSAYDQLNTELTKAEGEAKLASAVATSNITTATKGYQTQILDYVLSGLTTGLDSASQALLMSQFDLTTDNFIYDVTGKAYLKWDETTKEKFADYMNQATASIVSSLLSLSLTFGGFGVDLTTFSELTAAWGDQIKAFFSYDITTGNYTWTGTVESYVETAIATLLKTNGLIDSVTKQYLSRQLSIQAWTSKLNARSLQEKYTDQYYASTYTSAVSELGVSALLAATLILHLGLTMQDFLLTADGNFQLITDAQLANALLLDATIEDIIDGIDYLNEKIASQTDGLSALTSIYKLQLKLLQQQKILKQNSDLANFGSLDNLAWNGVSNYLSNAYSVLQNLDTSNKTIDVSSLLRIARVCGLGSEAWKLYQKSLTGANLAMKDGQLVMKMSSTLMAGLQQSSIKLLKDYAMKQYKYWMSIAEMYLKMDSMDTENIQLLTGTDLDFTVNSITYNGKTYTPFELVRGILDSLFPSDGSTINSDKIINMFDYLGLTYDPNETTLQIQQHLFDAIMKLISGQTISYTGKDGKKVTINLGDFLQFTWGTGDGSVTFNSSTTDENGNKIGAQITTQEGEAVKDVIEENGVITVTPDKPIHYEFGGDTEFVLDLQPGTQYTVSDLNGVDIDTLEKLLSGKLLLQFLCDSLGKIIVPVDAKGITYKFTPSTSGSFDTTGLTGLGTGLGLQDNSLTGYINEIKLAAGELAQSAVSDLASKIQELGSKLTTAATAAKELLKSLGLLPTNTTVNVNENDTTTTSKKSKKDKSTPKKTSPTRTRADDGLSETQLTTTTSNIVTITPQLLESAVKQINESINNMIEPKTLSITSSLDSESYLSAMDSINTIPTTRTVQIKIKSPVPNSYKITWTALNAAANGIALAEGTTGLPSGTPGQTLVGLLGPLLLVRNGKYNILGSQGALFVNLQKGDIVFDAEKTKKLMSGSNGVRGKAMARGGIVGGDALASGNAEKAKEIALTWKNLANNLSNIFNNDGGGGGGGGSSSEYLMKLARWFNWLQRIERILGNINELEAERLNLTGKASADNLLLQNELLVKQAAAYKDLYTEQKKYLLTEYISDDGNGNWSLQGNYSNYAKYFSIDADTKALQINYNAIKQDTMNNEDLADELQDFMDLYTLVQLSIELYQEKLQSALLNIKENIELIQLAYTDTEDLVLLALKNRYQEEIDLKQLSLDKKKLLDNEYLTSLRNSLKKLKLMRESALSSTDIVDLLRKIALLLRDTSGKNAKLLASLRDELLEAKNDKYYEDRLQAIDDLLLAMTTEQDTYQKLIDALTLANEIKLDNMLLYWELVHKIMLQGTESILSLLEEYNDLYIEASKLQQQILIDLWTNTIGMSQDYSQAKLQETGIESALDKYYNQNMDLARVNYKNLNLSSATMSTKTEGTGKKATTVNTWSYDVSLYRKDLNGNLVLDLSGNPIIDTVTKTASSNATDTLEQEKYKLIARAKYALKVGTVTKGIAASNKDMSDGGGYYFAVGDDNYGNYATVKDAVDDLALMKLVYRVMAQISQELYETINKDPTATSDSKKTAKTNADAMKKKSKAANKITAPKTKNVKNKVTKETTAQYSIPNSSDDKDKKAGLFHWYKNGGMVDYTGIAQVDGTPTDPEAFLNADQTAMFQRFIQLMQDYNLNNSLNLDSLQSILSNTSNNFGSVYINIDSGVVANQAQAKQLSKEISDLLMAIARRNGNVRVTRR